MVGDIGQRMYTIKQHQIWLQEALWRVRFSIFLIWVEGFGKGTQLFVLSVLLSTIQKELLNISIL